MGADAVVEILARPRLRWTPGSRRRLWPSIPTNQAEAPIAVSRLRLVILNQDQPPWPFPPLPLPLPWPLPGAPWPGGGPAATSEPACDNKWLAGTRWQTGSAPTTEIE